MTNKSTDMPSEVDRQLSLNRPTLAGRAAVGRLGKEFPLDRVLAFLLPSS